MSESSLHSDKSPHKTKRKSQPQQEKFKGAFWEPFLLFLAACILLGAIIFIALLTFQAEQASQQNSPLGNTLKLTVSQTLTLVSLLQGLLILDVTILLTRALLYLQWGLSARDSGLPYLDFLALSPMTLNGGSLLLIFSSASLGTARVWSSVRVLMFALVWLSSIVLFFRTSLVTAFDTAESYNVTAGVGPFNASYIPGFLESLNSTAPDYPFTTLPYSYYGMLNNLIANPIVSTVVESSSCRDDEDDCASYLLSGGVWSTAPWIPGDHADYPLVRLNSVPAIQVDFRGKHGQRDFKDGECQLFGSPKDLIGVELCVREEGTIGGIYGALFVCTEGVLDGKCITSTPAPNLTTTVVFHRRKTNLLVSKKNYTISDTELLGQFDPAPISELQAYKDVLKWLLDYAGANIPAPSSIIENFWTASEQLQTPVTDNFYLQHLRSILVFPVWLFNANNYGNQDLTVMEIGKDLPPEFYTNASLVRPYLKLRFDSTILGIFVGCQAIVLVFSAAVLIWAFCRAKALPYVSSFPVFDSYFKPEVKVREPMDHGSVWHAGDKEVVALMKDARVMRKPTPWPLPPGWI